MSSSDTKYRFIKSCAGNDVEFTDTFYNDFNKTLDEPLYINLFNDLPSNISSWIFEEFRVFPTIPNAKIMEFTHSNINCCLLKDMFGAIDELSNWKNQLKKLVDELKANGCQAQLLDVPDIRNYDSDVLVARVAYSTQ